MVLDNPYSHKLFCYKVKHFLFALYIKTPLCFLCFEVLLNLIYIFTDHTIIVRMVDKSSQDITVH